MCTFAEQKSRDGICYCFEEISLMILVQRILMYLWYRLVLKMFPRLSVLPSCNDCSGHRRSFPCGQLADQYWKASYFSRTRQQTTKRHCDTTLQQPFSSHGCCDHKPVEPVCDQTEQEEEELFKFHSSDMSEMYQSTFLDDYDECLQSEDIAWDVPVPEMQQEKPFQERMDQLMRDQLTTMVKDYYIDDDMEDHLKASKFPKAAGIYDSWIY